MRTHPLGVFTYLRILKGFKSFVLELRILKGLWAFFAELRNLKGIAASHRAARSHVFGAMRGCGVRRAGNASVITDFSVG